MCFLHGSDGLFKYDYVNITALGEAKNTDQL